METLNFIRYFLDEGKCFGRIREKFPPFPGLLYSVQAFGPSTNALTAYLHNTFYATVIISVDFQRVDCTSSHVSDSASHFLADIETTVPIDASEENMVSFTNFLYEIRSAIAKPGAVRVNPPHT